MTIIPIFRREMVAAARQGRLQTERSSYVLAQLLMAIVAVATWYELQGSITLAGMGPILDQVLAGCIAVHLMVVGTVLVRGALSIVGERTRRTLDFLLVTRLSAGEIIIGKLAGCLTITLASLAAGLPVMLLLHTLGGVELRLIVLIYGGVGSTSLLLSSLATWVSTEVADRRSAILLYTLCVMTWLIGPESLAILPPKWGVRLPVWVATPNWWLASASPVLIVIHVLLGMRSWTQLVGEVEQMVVLQLGMSVLLTILAIWRLRPAHRAIASVDREGRRRAQKRFVWRVWPRPPVGNDPIFWRERFAPHYNGFVKAVNLAIWGVLLLLLAVGTFHSARAAFFEALQQGFLPTGPVPEGDFLARLIMRGKGWATGMGGARADFNVFIRGASLVIVLVISFLAWGIAAEVVAVERMKETWPSLLATPLEGRDILRAAVLTALWRCRLGFAGLLVLWALGVALGATHPVGVLVASLVLAASFWLSATVGVLGAIQARKAENAAGPGLAVSAILMMTGLLPLMLTGGTNAVILGAGSMPLMVWTALVTYHEMAVATAAPLTGTVHWLGLRAGQMPLVVFASWAIAIVWPAVLGTSAWRYGITHFDCLVGRPRRTTELQRTSAVAPPENPLASGRGCPLAEADRAV